MDPVTLVLVPGLLGGLVVALLFFLAHRRPSDDGIASPSRGAELSTDVINMSSIKVAGIGGLGFVAMAIVVALNVPRIGQVVAVGLVLGIAVAAVLILRRRATGSMPSSGRKMGANSTLSIDAPVSRPGPEDVTRRDGTSRRSVRRAPEPVLSLRA